MTREMGLATPAFADGHGVYAVHAALRKAVLSGALTPDTEYSQVELAREMGVSRTPLREAIRMLEREGLVHLSPNKKCRIAGYSVQDMEDLYGLRISIESTAIRLTVQNLTSEDGAELVGLLTQMKFFAAREDYDRYQVPHRAFHDRLVAKSTPRMIKALSELSDHCERYRRLNTTALPHAWEKAMEQHEAILNACLESDGDTAALRLAEHLASTVLGNIDLLAPSYRPETLLEVLRVVKTGASQDHR